MCAEKGVNPWIEVDGGVGPKNAYKVEHEVALYFMSHSVIEVSQCFGSRFSLLFGAKDYAEAKSPLLSPYKTLKSKSSFTFVSGRLADLKSRPFEVEVARFPLQLPDYIFIA
ncbi:hypothetical protein LOK49_LG08G00023 [Camellia lanceoleosa]|uniref:Uncharacterized protein n=1 Tax=Camellia lanceoleosa TaxID=1840588 RepID=A0ACC0GQM0_9ERIC|nr:hypothetical protein LOK49_LG08G00023 [Camellia lanceoleosa]